MQDADELDTTGHARRMMPPVIEIRDATLVRGGTRVLEHLTLTVAAGEHTAVLGPNGAGKSSLIRMLTLEDRPRATDNGVPPLRLFGHSSWDVTRLRTRLGVVTGDLDAGFGLGTSGGRVSGADAALSGLLGSHGVFAHHDVTSEMRALAEASLARVDALHLARKPLNEMSAGERRRVLIARALITRPDALVLDEPTAGLDPVARYRFMESVRRLARDGTTLVLVTHHIDEIIPEIKRVVLLRRGAVAFDGTTEDALTSRRLGTIFGGDVVVERSRGYYYVRPRGASKWSEGNGMAKYSRSASKNVERTMRRRKRGTLKSGSGRTVKSRKQAIAIGLSEARKKGARVPAKPRAGSAKKTAKKR